MVSRIMHAIIGIGAYQFRYNNNNTVFFHKTANMRKRVNTIHNILSNGQNLTTDKDTSVEVDSYFRSAFGGNSNVDRIRCNNSL